MISGAACVIILSVLLAEAFVLLALNPDGSPARGASNQPVVRLGVTGALVTELVQQGHVDLTGGRIHATGSRPNHPVLIQALDNLMPHEGKKLKGRFASVKHAGWKEVVDFMIEDGLLGREKHGLWPTRHPVIDSAAQAAVLSEVRAAAAGDGPIEPRTAGLLALAGPSQLLEIVAPERAGRAHAKRRIKEATEQVPAAAAVQYAVESMYVAVAAGAFVAITGS